MALVVYYTDVSSSPDIKKKQKQIFDWLNGQKIEYEIKDVSERPEIMQEMRAKAVNCPDKWKALPPQIFKGDIHLGGYDDIFDAVEEKDLRGFLKLDGDGDSSQQTQQAQQP